jgi:hypothetical protein
MKKECPVVYLISCGIQAILWKRWNGIFWRILRMMEKGDSGR